MHAAAVRTRTIAIGGGVGAIAGALVALAGHWWAMRHLPRYFGYVSLSPEPDDVMPRLGIENDWWGLLWPATSVGLAVGAFAALFSALRGRRVSTRPWLPALLVTAVGAVLGLAVAGALYLRSGTHEIVGAPRRFVDYLPDSHDAYDSSLAVTFGDPGNVPAFFVVCGLAGLVLGLVTGVADFALRSRGTLRSWRPEPD